MSFKKFCLHPGYVRAKDGDIHMVGVGSLVHLFELNHGEYQVCLPNRPHIVGPSTRCLFPSASGKYGRPRNTKKIGNKERKATCVAVITSLTELPEDSFELPLTVGQKFVADSGVEFVIQSFKSVRIRNPHRRKVVMRPK